MLIRTSFAVGTLLHQKYLDQCQIWTKARCYDDSCHTIPWSKRVLWKLETLSLFFLSTKCILNCWRCVPWKSKFCLGVHQSSCWYWGNQFEHVIAEKEVKAAFFRSDISSSTLQTWYLFSDSITSSLSACLTW